MPMTRPHVRVVGSTDVLHVRFAPKALMPGYASSDRTARQLANRPALERMRTGTAII